MSRIGFNIDDLAKSRSAPFCSTGEDFSSPAIRNEFGWFHPHLRPAHKAPRPVDGLFASPSILMISQKVALRLFARQGRIFSPLPSEMNSDTPPHLRPAREALRPVDGFSNKSFAVVIGHHEKLPNNLIVDGEIIVGRDSIPDK